MRQQGWSRCVCVLLLTLALASSAMASHWQRIDTQRYELIFPADIAPQAQHVAALLDAYLPAHLQALPMRQPLRKIPIVLFADEHTANGNVGIAPYRSRWYNRPANFANLEWYTALAVHESRHIVQFNQLLEHPVGQISYIFLGESGQGLLLFALVPTWYLEGDAVVSETALTRGGRGRVAAFDLWLRSDLLNHPPYSYDRAMLGTGFDRTPYHSIYLLGYFLVGQAQMRFGEQVFERVLANLMHRGSLNFNSAFQQQTERSLTEHYYATMAQLTSRWQAQQDQLQVTAVTPIQPAVADHWRSIYPVGLLDGNPIVLVVDVAAGNYLAKSGPQQQLTRLTPMPAQVARNYYSTTKAKAIYQYVDRFCWVANHRHPTKAYLSFGDLECWQANQGRKRLTRNDKLTSAVPIDNGFIAHRFTAQRRSELVLFDRNVEQQRQWSLPAGSLATDFSYHQQQLVFILSGSARDGIYQLNLASGQLTRLMSTENRGTVRAPMLTAHWLIFTSDETGIDQLYALSRHGLGRYQISSRPYGSYFPIWDSVAQRLIVSDYTPTGQQLVALPFTDQRGPESGWQRQAEIAAEPFIEPLIPEKLPEISIKKTYDVQPYSVANHLWNPHSWFFAADNNGFVASVLSQDVLDKLALQVSAGEEADTERYWSSVQANYRLDAGPYLNPSLKLASDGEVEARFALAQPMIWQQGLWHQQLELTTGIEWQTDEPTRIFGRGEFTMLREHSLQSIAAKGQWQQLLYIDQNDNQKKRLLTSTELLYSPSSRSALAAQVQLQHLEYDDALVGSSAIVADLSETGWGVRYQLDAHWNPGAVGMALGPLAFWRNTTYGLHWLGQEQNDDNERALGFSVTPEMNLLRNTGIIVSPSFAYYYRLDTNTSRFAVSLIVAGE